MHVPHKLFKMFVNSGLTRQRLQSGDFHSVLNEVDNITLSHFWMTEWPTDRQDI
jgi:hypothetical protein